MYIKHLSHTQISAIFCSFILFFACSCEKQPKEQPEEENDMQTQYVNVFAKNVIKTYYLWVDEVKSAIDKWEMTDEPIETVKTLRYKDSAGKDIDKWTTLSDDFSSFVNSVAGVSTTYGVDLSLMYYDSSKKNVVGIVLYTSPNSPASKAGLKRGDVINKIGGKTIATDEYKERFYNDFLYASSCKLTLLDGREISMSAVEMYEDPILLSKVFGNGDKKVGYLVYNSFTLDSIEPLVEICTQFKEEGISELILDLRYNSGGYVTTEYALASMLAPASEVEAKSVFETAVYNKTLAQHFEENKQELCVRFSQDFSFTSNGKKHSISTKDANIGISKIYAIITGRSASASESILTGLMPYMDIEMIGEQSYGKYCTGLLYSASEWYEDCEEDIKKSWGDEQYADATEKVDNWGIYVMLSRYADKDGNTACMPDGFIPDIAVDDNPLDGYALGETGETLLKTALNRAGLISTSKAASKRSPATLGMEPLGFDYLPRNIDCNLPYGQRVITSNQFEIDHSN